MPIERSIETCGQGEYHDGSPIRQEATDNIVEYLELTVDGNFPPGEEKTKEYISHIQVLNAICDKLKEHWEAIKDLRDRVHDLEHP